MKIRREYFSVGDHAAGAGEPGRVEGNRSLEMRRIEVSKSSGFPFGSIFG